jgi:hypothetical protein
MLMMKPHPPPHLGIAARAERRRSGYLDDATQLDDIPRSLEETTPALLTRMSTLERAFPLAEERLT